MSLTSDLISQFVKITNDNTKTKSETTVYGTMVEVDGTMFVKLDGSEILTPVTATANTKPGERVTVLIKNHTATVTGNLSSPAARLGDVENLEDAAEKITEFEIVLAKKVDTAELNVERGRIDELLSDNVKIRESLTANEADIDNLQATTLTVTEELEAAEANITKLQTDKLDAEIAEATFATIENLDATNLDVHNLEATYGEFASATADRLDAAEADINDLNAVKGTIENLDATYANIDFSNIGKAAIEQFFSKSGIIENVVVGEGTVTGKLVGVTIAGDLIEGNTVVAEKLVIKGEDGLYYKLNTDGVTTEAEQTDYNSLNGSVIRAKSVTADKISVTDLVAFGATIAGLNMTDGTLYSGAKNSVNNTTIGIYMDKHGQIAIGDADNYIKYYTDSNGDRRLEISADSLVFGASKKNVESVIRSETLKVGDGGNLLINGAPTSGDEWILNHGVTYKDGYFAVPAYTPATEGGRGDTVSQNFVNRIPFASAARNLKISCDIRDASGGNQTGKIAFWIRWKNAEGTQNWPSVFLNLDTLTSEWTHFSGVITIPADTRGDGFGIGLYTTSAFDIRCLFLEEVTDLQNVQTDVNSAINAANNTSERLSSAESLIAQLSENISMLVTDGNGTSLMTQTENGWVFSTSDIQKAVNDASENLSSLTDELGDVNSSVDILRQAVADLGVLAEYVKIGTYEDEPCIELGEGDSDFKLLITNTRIMFMEGTGVPAHFTNQSMHIKKAVIEDELQQGGFVWKARSNGNLGLVWKGVTD